VANFLDEVAYRTRLAWGVLTGMVPIEMEKRFWNRSLETPVLIDVGDWVTTRRICTVLVWPPLESPPEDAQRDYGERVVMVKQVLAKGASDMALTTSFETDYDLRWEHERKVWVSEDGFAYDGRLGRDG
jgi:hypothetical protein